MKSIINKEPIYRNDLKVGKLYSDIPNEEGSTILEFVELDEDESPMFKYVSGVKSYLELDGLIGFNPLANDEFYEVKGTITLSND